MVASQQLTPEEWNTRASKLRGYYKVSGYNAQGIYEPEIVPGPIPSLYFWLGSEAYPDWPIVDRLTIGEG